MSDLGRIEKRVVIGAVLCLAVASAIASARATEPLGDPTQPPAAALHAVDAPEKSEDQGLELRAIFHAGERRIAVINGRRVRVNDRIAGARVLAIDVDRVRVERGGEIVELELVSRAFKDAREVGQARGGASR